MTNLTRERNFELLRLILLEIESSHPNQVITNLNIEGYDETIIILHVEILKDNDYIEAEMMKTLGGNRGFLIKKILPEGYEFLDNAKNDNIWKKFKAKAERKGSSMSMAVANGLLTAAAKKYFGLD